MKWKCIDCYAVFHAAGGMQANCPQCGSVNCFDCNVEPVDARSEGLLRRGRLQLVEEMPAELERMPVRPGVTQRSGTEALMRQLEESLLGAVFGTADLFTVMGRRAR